MGGRRESLHGTVWILTQKKILRKKKGGVWCSLHRCTRKLIDSQWKGIRVERRNRSKDFSLTRGIIFLMVKFHFHHISHPNQEPVQWCHRTWGKSFGFHCFMLVFFVACGMMSLVQGTWTLLSKFGFPLPPPPASSYSSIIHLSPPTKRCPAKTVVLMSLLSPITSHYLINPRSIRQISSHSQFPFFSGFRVSWNVQETSQATVAPWEPLHLPPQRLMSMWLISWQATNLPYLYPYQWK